MFKSIVAATAVFASALFAHAASYISGVDPAAGSMGNEGNAYTVSELKSASDMSDYNLGTDRGWVAGIKLTWQNNQQNATQTTEEFGDSAGWRSQSSFTVYNNGDKTPSGSGLKNATTSTTVLWTTTYYNSTAEWYVYVTPEKMYQWSKNGVETYTATLTVKETNRAGLSNVTTPTVYTITIPTNLMLTDSEGVAWYPAVGLLGEKVYGEMQYLADQITADNYETVKFLNEPVGVEFTTGFAASANGDGTWGVVMTHSHDWHFTFADGVLTATCGNGGCPVNNGSTTLSLVLSDSDKDYDGVEITPSLVFGDGFESSFENAQVVVAVTKGGESVETISDIGEYTVTMTVTGLGDGETYTPTKTVTISPLDISSATLVLAPASTTYSAEEQTVTPSVTVDGLAATIEVADGSTTAATEIGEYTVTVNGTGNFTGTTSGTWDIVNTTGSLKGVAATTDASAGSYVDGTLTVTDTTALEYADNAWTAGLTLTWPIETKNWQSISDSSSHAYYVTEDSVKVSTESGVIAHSVCEGSYRSARNTYPTFDYVSNTTWKVEITPAVVEAALAEQKTSLEYTMRAGAIASETYAQGVAFADYKIELSLEDPILFVLGENETHDLGETVLTTTRIKLAPGASVTSGVAQTDGVIFTDSTGYNVVCSESDGVYTYAAQFTHSHDWHFAVADNGYELVATCSNDDCDLNGEVRMWLHVDAVEKEYDGQPVNTAVAFDEDFESVFSDLSTTLTVNGVENGTINTAGVYTVALSVTGIGGDEPHELSTTVTISPVDITDATLVLTPASTTYSAEEQTVTPSVTVDGLAATIEVADGSTTAATEIGTYSVTVNGTGNFTGTTSGTWDIVNTTGSLKGVAATTSETAGNYTDGTLTVTDTTALAYADGAWTAGITLTWPMESDSPLVGNGYGHYVKPETMQMTIGEAVYTGREIVDSEAVYAKGKLEAEVKNGSYTYYQGLSRRTQNFSYLSSTTWTVAITPAVIEAALTEEKTALEYTMRAGALVWGDNTEGDPDGVTFADYKIELSLEDPILFVLDENETHNLGETVLTTTKIKLAPGASVTTTVQQTEGLIFIETPGYDVVWSEDAGVYTYTTKFTHEHAWTFDVVDGTNLVATCGNDDCDVGGEVRMWLDVGTTEKEYDGQFVTRKAEFDANFAEVFPDASTTLTVNGVENGTINTAGVYTVELAVTGLGDNETYRPSAIVTINKKDISGATLVLTPASTTYNAAEQTVSASVTVDAVTATLDNGLEVVEGTCSATEIDTYSVTVNGKGNFTGSLTGTWKIVNTTGSLSGVAATTSADAGSYADGTLTVTDTTALAYADNAWTAGLTLTWPVETKNWQALDWSSHAYYVTTNDVKITNNDGEIEHSTLEGSYTSGLNQTSRFNYLATTTWTVGLTPATIEAALAENKTVIEYAMRAGAIKSDTYANGVAFADYKIELSLEDPIVFVLGENETHDLGETVLTTTRIKLAPGASVTSSAAQANGAIFTEATGYEVERSESGGVYTYTTKFTHQHNWSFEVIDGTNLVATCRNEQCNVNGNETRMWLDVGTTEKDYDGLPVTINAEFDEYFKDVFPGVATSLTVNEVADGTINNAGDYAVVLAVTGLKADTQHELSVNVKINRKDISGGTLVLSPASTTYNAAEQAVTPSVTVGGVTATLDNGLEVVEGTCSATEIGTYSVTVNGTGNFTGTAASATWSIVNTTGEPTSVTESAAGSMTKNGNDFTLSDSSKLEYDSENKAWYAGITISWPVETKDWQALSQNSHAYYVTEDCVRITKDVGEVVHTPGKGSYITGYNWLQPINSEFDYLARTTWTVELTPAIIEAAFAEEKTVLEYTLRAGAIPSDTYAQGVAFRDYTITIPLEGITLYDGDGKQVYPEAEGQTIIEDIKDDIGDVVSDAEVAEGAKAKIDLLAGVAGEGNEQSVAEWVDSMKGDDAATFYAELAQSEYVGASFELGTQSLISDASDVEVAEFESTDGGFTLAVTIDGEDIEAARVKAASIVQTATSLDGEFGPLDAERIEISESGEMTVKKGDNADCEFFKIMISKDSAE